MKTHKKLKKSKSSRLRKPIKYLSGIKKGPLLISKLKAKEIASDWHGGQWSALYQFASSGIYLPETHKKYLNEIADNIPLASLTQKRLLRKLKAWFIYKHKEHKHSL